MVELILDRLNELLVGRGWATIDPSEVRWVFDESVSWGEDASVAADALLKGPEAEAEIRRRGEGSSWIHANLTRSSDGRPLVTLDVGARVGNPAPTINVSVERDRTITIEKDAGRGSE